ncbi:unnamed protein product [Rotaria sordida]|uniref:RING-type domain-containing protein n=1 Tax=Rotaria sordida TaxID=392033 RepID=A0A813UKQ3_9BILA|nr:unnamed protein product [Rotaria sordida]CAF0829032.1 unnamed protein product [Rotaria sordida]CAF0910558.1 unnamed protein product [Rotaria sordida]CAF3811300.1 unnamed protein product [Rotaria sordida]
MLSTLFSQKHNDPCEICFDQMSTDITLITCRHRQKFCETCIQSWLKLGKFTCPKCRTLWPVIDYLEQTNQSIINTANILLKLEYHPTLFNGNVPFSTPLTAGYLMNRAVMCCSIGLLICLIIYPTMM